MNILYFYITHKFRGKGTAFFAYMQIKIVESRKKKEKSSRKR